MQAQRARFVVALLAWLLQPVAGAAVPASSKAELLREVTVKAETITLSDFLPGAAPAVLRTDCLQVDLGRAPQPGAVREVSRDEIKNLLSPELEGELEIPARVLVHRAARTLGRDELGAAIREALGRQGFAALGSFELDDINLTAPVYITQDDPGLEVTRVEYDAVQRRARFRLWTSKEPQILPFYVSLDYRAKSPQLVAKHEIGLGQKASPADFQMQARAGATGLTQPALTPADLAGFEARVPVKPGQVVTRSMFKPVVLVEPGVPAKLEVEGNGFRVVVTVIPLQRGSLGQQIRARNPDTNKLFIAEVVGWEKLRTTY